MYRVFESLDELVTILEEARGLPMTSSCVVPRGDALDLLDEIRDALPGDLDDAQDVLDRRDEIIGQAEHQAEQAASKARLEAEQIVAEAVAETDRRLTEATARAERMVADGRAEYESLVGRSKAEAERMIQAGRDAFEAAVEEGRIEQARLVSQTEVVQAAHVESARILDATAEEAARQRKECDEYVDGKLREFEDLLAHILRTVGKGRTHLRGTMNGAGAGVVPFDYRA